MSNEGNLVPGTSSTSYLAHPLLFHISLAKSLPFIQESIFYFSDYFFNPILYSEFISYHGYILCIITILTTPCIVIL